MGIRDRMHENFSGLRGGLFSEVARADVGEAAEKLMRRGIDIMAWADPFFPDPSIPESVKRAMIEAVEEGFPSHYSMPIGLYDLRKVIADKIHSRTGLEIDPGRNLIVTPGSDSGLLYAMMPFIRGGDEVMVTDPSYPSNFLNPELLGGVTVPVPIYAEDNYQVRISEFEKRLTDKTKMLLITHPNNPTTTVFRRDSITGLCGFVKDNDLVLVSDQAFEDHIFDDIEFVHPAALPGMWERTLTVCSVSKGLGLSGFRIGYIYAQDEIMDVLYGGAVNVLGAASTITSIGAAAALRDEEILKDNFRRFERRRRAAHAILSSAPGVRMMKPESGILSWIDVSRIGASAEVAKYILDEAGILVNDGRAYGARGEGWLRIVSACFRDDEQAAERLMRIRDALTRLAQKKGVI